jgi:choline dehydrogenase-like flavoprotein
MLRRLESDNRPSDALYDVCIIGAGAAGITISTNLARRGYSVMLAEGGELQPTPDSLNLYRGQVVGDPYFDLTTTRLRYFGGSTGHWGGWCRALDPGDFEAKSASRMTAWPIAHEQLDDYAAAAAAILKLPEAKPDRSLNSDFNEIFFRFSPPVKFGDEYRDEIVATDNLDAFLNCNLIGFGFDGASISTAEFANYADLKVSVRAKRFVLACGGIENSRILLHANEKYDDRLGNRSDLVGKYWSEHNVFTLGEFLLFDDDAFTTELRETDPGRGRRRIFIGPSEQFLERERILNCGIRLTPYTFTRKGAQKHLERLLCASPDLSKRVLKDFGERLVCAGQIRAAWEQYPDIGNKVVLSAQRDRFGLKLPELRWKKSRRDKLAPRRSATALGRYLAEKDIGRIQLAPWLLQDNESFPGNDEIAGNHHMGGTRMAERADDGVVDPDCRVFGTSNLHIAGSSVFPSCGHANPTFTIVQLALRLSDHLSNELRA